METIEEYNKFRIVRDNDGLLGLIFNSEVIEHCEYNEITRMDDYFLCRKAGMEKQIDFNGKTCMTATMNPDPAENKGADGYIIVCSKNQNMVFCLLIVKKFYLQYTMNYISGMIVM